MRLVSLLPKSGSRLTLRAHQQRVRRPALAYALALSGVILGLIVIPITYISALVGTAWLLYSHLTGKVGWLQGPESSITTIALYLLMGTTLGLLGYFLIRPFLQPSQKMDADLSLSPQSEPRLHAFVQQVCTAIGSTAPERIQVNMDVNASVRFAPGFGNFWAGRLELVLGLPLLRGLDLAQFAGVLSHELGHFQQGSAMRLVHAIRTLIQWFQNAASGEEEWERTLVKKSHRLDPLLYLPFWYAKICAMAVRTFLKAHAYAGQIVSCLLLRQMEYQADKVAIRMVGGETFSTMVLEAKVIESAWALANRSLGMALREGRLADDLPALVAAHTRVFIPEVRRKMERTLLQEKSVWFDTHPRLSTRLQRARQSSVRGMFHAAGRADALFSDFPLLSRQASVLFYRQDLGDDFNSDRMISTSDLVTGQSEIQVGEAAVNGYFLGFLSNLRPVWLSPFALQNLPNGDQLRKMLNQARETVEQEADKVRSLYRGFALADAKQVDAIHALALLRANFWIEPEDFQLPKGGISQAEKLLAESEAEQRVLAAQLSTFESAMQSRLTAALGLLTDPEVADHLKDAYAVSKEVSRLLPTLQAIGSIQLNLESLRRSLHAMGILLENLAGNENADELDLQLRLHAKAMASDLEAIQKGLSQLEYPFGLHSAGAGLAEYAIPSMPPMHDFSAYHLATEEVLGRCYALYFRILGRLALAAGRVEGVLGLGPLQVGGSD